MLQRLTFKTDKYGSKYKGIKPAIPKKNSSRTSLLEGRQRKLKLLRYENICRQNSTGYHYAKFENILLMQCRRKANVTFFGKTRNALNSCFPWIHAKVTSTTAQSCCPFIVCDNHTQFEHGWRDLTEGKTPFSFIFPTLLWPWNK